MVFPVLQLSWSLEEKSGRFLERKKEQSGPRTGSWTLLGEKKTIFRIKKNGPNFIKTTEQPNKKIVKKIEIAF